MPVRALWALLGLKGPAQAQLGPPSTLTLGPQSPSSAHSGNFGPCLSYVVRVLSLSHPPAWPCAPDPNLSPQTDLLSSVLPCHHSASEVPWGCLSPWLPPPGLTLKLIHGLTSQLVLWPTSSPQPFLMVWTLGRSQLPSPGTAVSPGCRAVIQGPGWWGCRLREQPTLTALHNTFSSKQRSIYHQEGSPITNYTIKLTLPTLRNTKFTEVEQHDLMAPFLPGRLLTIHLNWWPMQVAVTVQEADTNTHWEKCLT